MSLPSKVSFYSYIDCLYSEIQLLGHEELRKNIGHTIRQRYLDGYESILLKIDKKPMTNQEVK